MAARFRKRQPNPHHTGPGIRRFQRCSCGLRNGGGRVFIQLERLPGDNAPGGNGKAMPEKQSPPQPTKAAEPPGTGNPGGDADCQPGGGASTASEKNIEERRTVKEFHVKEDLLDFTELVRSIQRAEGNQDCFRKIDVCPELDCTWRSYCQIEPACITP